MSDALTDISRDERRNNLAIQLLIKASEWIQKPTKKLGTELIKLAEQCDDVPRGYWNGPTKFKQVTENMVNKNEIAAFVNLWKVDWQTLPYLKHFGIKGA